MSPNDNAAEGMHGSPCFATQAAVCALRADSGLTTPRLRPPPRPPRGGVRFRFRFRVGPAETAVELFGKSEEHK
eukprot:610933-Prorocentrum_minimum.AAC.1